MRRWLAAVALVAACVPAAAIDSAPAFDDPALQARYEGLTDQIRCLVCQNNSIADSSALLAADLRAEIRDMIADGRSDREIIGFLTQRYGDFVLYRPPWAPRTWLLWLGPLILLGAGVWVAARIVIARSRLPVGDETIAANPEPRGE